MRYCFIFLVITCVLSCKKSGTNQTPTPVPPASFSIQALTVNGNLGGLVYYNVSPSPSFRVAFSTAINRATISNGITLTEKNGGAVSMNTTFQNNDSVLILQPTTPLKPITEYTFSINNSLLSKDNGTLQTALSIRLITAIDSTDKFPRISDTALLDLVQRQTFKYFWDFGHPTSGLARERNTSGDLVTTGGSGFGIMAIVTGIHRGFVTRAEGFARLQKIVGFLKNNAQKFHGAFPHWLNGNTGAVIPFSARDNGADLVETSFLLQGLLTARQYFSGADAAETTLRADINTIWHGVEWNKFRKNNDNQLYWHLSPSGGFDINLPVRGWNESLVVYVLAASSPTHAIPKAVYDNGWASNGNMRNNNTYYGYQLPLGPALGGPLFFEHYSFLGINPFGLSDQYANYQTQAINHTRINYEYAKADPKDYGYSELVWGLTASDIPNGYTASSPNNDVGVIAPTAAISSMPYTPAESMAALKFFYYKLGDRLWGEYGFYDAFSLKDGWFASTYLAIDQGPIIVMIENYRSSLLWNLFTSSPEIKTGMRSLGFSAPYL